MSEMDPNDPVMDTASEYMWQMAVIGYHVMHGTQTIVLVVAREPAGQRDPSMPEVRDGITQTLRSRREQLLRTAYLSALRNDAVVVNHLARRLVESQGKMPSLAPTQPGTP